MMQSVDIIWSPIEELDRSKDDTYLVRVENVGGGVGKGWVDKAWFANDTRRWYRDALDASGRHFPIEHEGVWKITAFARWPEMDDRPSLKAEIAAEIYRAFESFGALSDLLSIIGSYGDTLPDADVLSMLRDWNAARTAEAA